MTKKAKEAYKVVEAEMQKNGLTRYVTADRLVCTAEEKGTRLMIEPAGDRP